MALFAKANPLDTAIAARAKLRIRLREAVEATKDAVKDLHALNEADDVMLDAAETLVRSRQDREKTLTVFLTDSDAKILDLEAKRDAALDQKHRNDTEAEIAARRAAGADIAKKHQAVTLELIEWASWGQRIVPEIGGLLNYGQASSGEIPGAFLLADQHLANHAASVLRGDARATLPAPVVTTKPVVPVVPIRTLLFCTRSVKYVDPDNSKLVVIQKFQDGEFPPDYARAALILKIATRLDDPLRKQHHGTVAGNPEVVHAFDLDAAMHAPNPPAIDPIKASALASPFTVVDRGPAVQMKVPR